MWATSWAMSLFRLGFGRQRIEDDGVATVGQLERAGGECVLLDPTEFSQLRDVHQGVRTAHDAPHVRSVQSNPHHRYVTGRLTESASQGLIDRGVLKGLPG